MKDESSHWERYQYTTTTHHWNDRDEGTRLTQRIEVGGVGESKEYGDKQYYIVHFKKIYDVIDEENTVYDSNGWIIKLRVDYAKVKNLHVFNSQPIINDLIVSTKLYKEIKKRKLNFGVTFGPIYCLNKDKYVTK